LRRSMRTRHDSALATCGTGLRELPVSAAGHG
jgi:hypothetical protein